MASSDGCRVAIQCRCSILMLRPLWKTGEFDVFRFPKGCGDGGVGGIHGER